MARALLPFGIEAVQRGSEVLARLYLLRLTDRLLEAAGVLPPAGLRSLDAIHLATAQRLGSDLAHVVTYDDRMARAAAAMGWSVVAPR